MPCIKIAYVSRADARAACARPTAEGVRMRPVSCPICGMYHVTSKTSRERRAARKAARERREGRA